MQQVQLYIENERVELFKDESISLTESIQNVKDIDKIFTNFTKTFSVPASKTNNKIFKHYYNSNIVGGFDGRLKKNAVIKLNGVDFKKGKIKLQGVDLKSNKPNMYRITFLGSTVDLKDILGEDKLGVLGEQLDSFNKVYSAPVVKNGLELNPQTNDVIVPLITHTQRLYYKNGEHGQGSGNLWYESGSGTSHHHGVRWKELKFAIRLNRIIDAIESRYPSLNFSSDFFKNTSKPEFDDLFMWLHRKSGDVEPLGGLEKFDNPVLDFTTPDVEISEVLVYTLSIDVDSADINKIYDVEVVYRSGGGIAFSRTGLTGDQTFDITNTYNGLTSYTVVISTSESMLLTEVEVALEYEDFDGNEYQVYYTESNYQTTTNILFNIGQQFPDIKIIDFLIGLFKMFNLTAYVNEATSTDTNTNIVVKPLDDYYNTYDTHDITEYIDVDKQTVDVALPYKEISLTYKDTKTFLANRYNQIQNKAWGESIYSENESDLAGSLYKVEVPFSHMMFEKLTNNNTQLDDPIQYGWSVGENMDSYKGDPLLFYPVYTSVASNTISYVNQLDDDGAFDSHQSVSVANMPSNSLSFNASTSEKNINFDNEINEYTGSTEFEETLFEEYYKDYITDVFNPKNRITKLTAYLPLKILLKFTLADRFVVAGNKYKINSITTNLQTGESSMELLNDI